MTQFINQKYRAALESANLLDLPSLFTRQDLVPVKETLESRQTLRIETDNGVFYIKRYPKRVQSGSRFNLISKSFTSLAMREWHVLNLLQDLNIPTMHTAACLESPTQAALITAGLDAPVTLEKMAQSEWAKMPVARRARFANNVGVILRRMHDGGINHRDFYLVHLRVSADDTVYVTDLNRADIRKFVGRRWRVKDLAALQFSAPSSISNTDRARCFRAYANGDRLRDHKKLILAVLKKADAMHAHTKKKVENGEPNYHLND
ncbi:MAG: lipopolysaccharide kinase InaA family protein [Planctomycetota bacterium]